MSAKQGKGSGKGSGGMQPKGRRFGGSKLPSGRKGGGKMKSSKANPFAAFKRGGKR